MDDWYLDVCKRNMNKLSVVDNEQPEGGRPRSGSFKYTVTFVKGNRTALALLADRTSGRAIATVLRLSSSIT